MNIKNVPANLKGQVIGTITITKGEKVKHRQTYECAAWFTDAQAEPGTYDLVVGETPYAFLNSLNVHAKLRGTVTANDHTPLFCGNAIGRSEDRKGQRHDFEFALPALKALHNTHGRYDSEGWLLVLDVESPLFAEFAKLAIEQAEAELQWHKDCVVDELAKGNYGMVSHYAKKVENEEGNLRCARYTLAGNNNFPKDKAISI